MKLCTDTITVLNKRWDSTNGYDVYIPTVINNVSWYCEIASAVDNSGLHAANRVVVRIPANADFGGKQYTDPITYRDAQSVTGLFTLAQGDRIVKAAVTGNNLTPAQLDAQYTECCTVLGVTDNRRAPNAPHFKVVGG